MGTKSALTPCPPNTHATPTILLRTFPYYPYPNLHVWPLSSGVWCVHLQGATAVGPGPRLAMSPSNFQTGWVPAGLRRSKQGVSHCPYPRREHWLSPALELLKKKNQNLNAQCLPRAFLTKQPSSSTVAVCLHLKMLAQILLQKTWKVSSISEMRVLSDRCLKIAPDITRSPEVPLADCKVHTLSFLCQKIIYQFLLLSCAARSPLCLKDLEGRQRQCLTGLEGYSM